MLFKFPVIERDGKVCFGQKERIPLEKNDKRPDVPTARRVLKNSFAQTIRNGDRGCRKKD